MDKTFRVAIVGGGPSALFLLQEVIQTASSQLQLDIFEAGEQIGAGMPYSPAGANDEHVTNVSGNELPSLPMSLIDWMRTLSGDTLRTYCVDPDRLSEFKVVPRLLFGMYLRAQFDCLLARAKERGFSVRCHLNTRVIDVVNAPHAASVTLHSQDRGEQQFDCVILCTGHVWIRSHEGQHPGYFDSPYPPTKLAGRFNHPIAIRGTSLTAIDAVRTLALSHGDFVRDDAGKLSFKRKKDCDDFRIVMHSREGFLPGIRFHLEDPSLSKTRLLSEDELRAHMTANDGFISLDLLFELDFKNIFRDKEPEFYRLIAGMNLEQFVAAMMKYREESDAFDYFKREYAEASESIRSEQSVYWKEKLAVLSFAMNFPAKHFSAEDRLRLQNVLMPLISIVIAFTPQSSCEQLIALYDGGALDLVAVGQNAEIKLHSDGGIIYHYSADAANPASARFPLFVDCIGQIPLSFDKIPFASLKNGAVSRARLRFRSADEAVRQMEEGNSGVEQAEDGTYYLTVPGIAITDDFNVIGSDGAPNNRLYVMAVPLIAGYNPDYSGLDFCEAASKRIVTSIVRNLRNN